MQKTLYVERTVDNESGEVLKTKTITRKTDKVEHFVKAYIEDLGSIIGCSNSEKNLILCLLQLGYVEYESNEIVLNLSRKENLSCCAKINSRSMHNTLYRLIKKNIIIRSGKQLMLNPKLFFSGTEIQRDKLFELKIRYEIKPSIKSRFQNISKPQQAPQ